jgi:hypothetical protein
MKEKKRGAGLGWFDCNKRIAWNHPYLLKEAKTTMKNTHKRPKAPATREANCIRKIFN